MKAVKLQTYNNSNTNILKLKFWREFMDVVTSKHSMFSYVAQVIAEG
jgi:hypothetical protein